MTAQAVPQKLFCSFNLKKLFERADFQNRHAKDQIDHLETYPPPNEKDKDPWKNQMERAQKTLVFCLLIQQVLKNKINRDELAGQTRKYWMAPQWNLVRQVKPRGTWEFSEVNEVILKHTAVAKITKAEVVFAEKIGTANSNFYIEWEDDYNEYCYVVQLDKTNPPESRRWMSGRKKKEHQRNNLSDVIKSRCKPGVQCVPITLYDKTSFEGNILKWTREIEEHLQRFVDNEGQFESPAALMGLQRLQHSHWCKDWDKQSVY